MNITPNYQMPIVNYNLRNFKSKANNQVSFNGGMGVKQINPQNFLKQNKGKIFSASILTSILAFLGISKKSDAQKVQLEEKALPKNNIENKPVKANTPQENVSKDFAQNVNDKVSIGKTMKEQNITKADFPILEDIKLNMNIKEWCVYSAVMDDDNEELTHFINLYSEIDDEQAEQLVQMSDMVSKGNQDLADAMDEYRYIHDKKISYMNLLGKLSGSENKDVLDIIEKIYKLNPNEVLKDPFSKSALIYATLNAVRNEVEAYDEISLAVMNEFMQGTKEYKYLCDIRDRSGTDVIIQLEKIIMKINNHESVGKDIVELFY